MKKQVCIDLDGTLASYDGWVSIEHIGDPIPGAREFVESLAKTCRIVILTARVSVFRGDPGGQNAVTALDVVETWLERHGIPYDEVWTRQGKPPAIAYFDDRGISCRPQDKQGPKAAFDAALAEFVARHGLEVQ